MTRTEDSSLNPGDTRPDRGQTVYVCGYSSLEPDEGLRLLHMFFGIKQPALRQAIVTFVVDLSKLDHERA
jgi:hypothetical protein